MRPSENDIKVVAFQLAISTHITPHSNHMFVILFQRQSCLNLLHKQNIYSQIIAMLRWAGKRHYSMFVCRKKSVIHWQLRRHHRRLHVTSTVIEWESARASDRVSGQRGQTKWPIASAMRRHRNNFASVDHCARPRVRHCIDKRHLYAAESYMRMKTTRIYS